jgi:zinc protease
MLPVLAIAGLSACSHAPKVVKEGESPYFGTMRVHRYRLENGLKILALQDRSAPTFAYHTWFRVGSRDEQKGLTGLAHFFEHMMFKETKNLKEGEFDKKLEAAGAEGENAFTSRDYTGYVQSLPSDKLDLIAGLEAERMLNLVINDEALDKERQVVHNERRFRYENNPNGKMYERLYELSFAKHHYHWPVIGYAADLDGAKRSDFESFYKRFYAPNNATVVVVGDIDPDELASTVAKHYGKLPASEIDRKASPAEPRQTAEKTETMPIKSPVEKLMAAYRIPDVNSDEFPAIEVLRNVLGSGRSSRLHRKLVDTGIASSVDLESSENAEPGLFVFFVNLQKERTAAEALAVIDREVREIAAGRVSDEELERAISMHRFEIFDDLASNQSKAHFLGFYETVAGKFGRGVEILDGLKAVDRKALAAIAKNHLRAENRTVVIGKPETGKGG